MSPENTEPFKEIYNRLQLSHDSLFYPLSSHDTNCLIYFLEKISRIVSGKNDRVSQKIRSILALKSSDIMGNIFYSISAIAIELNVPLSILASVAKDHPSAPTPVATAQCGDMQLSLYSRAQIGEFNKLWEELQDGS